MTALWFVIPVLATVTWYLSCLATLTEPIWSRYPKWLDKFLQCPACSGTWFGLGWAFALRTDTLFGLASPYSYGLAALWCTFFVPVFGWVLVTTLGGIHAALGNTED